MRTEFSRQIFEKYANIKFHENPSRGSRVFFFHADRRRQTDMKKLIVAFRNFAKKKGQLNLTMTLHFYSILLEIFRAQIPALMRQFS